MSGRLQVEERADWAGLQALLPEWAALWEESSEATPFQSPAWLLPWVRCFAGRGWRVLLARRTGRLAGLLPLFLVDDPGGRRWLPMGAGISDYLDGVFCGEDAAEVATALVAAAVRRDDVELPQLRPGSPLLAAMGAGDRADVRAAGEDCPTLPLPAALPPRMRHHLRYYRRRAERAGVQAVSAVDADGAAALLEALFALHAARWQQRGQPGVLADPVVRAFHRAAVPALARAGLVRMHALRLGERVVAVLYALLGKRRVFHYIAGFDPQCAQLGLGTLVIGGAIEAAEADGALAFDFLRGREPYKYRWGAVDQPIAYRRLRVAAEVL